MASATQLRLAQTARRLIAKEGMELVLRRKNDDGTTTDLKTLALRSAWTDEELKDTSILTTDTKFIIPNTVKPHKSDIPFIDGKQVGTIINIMPVSPAKVAIIYKLQIRV